MIENIRSFIAGCPYLDQDTAVNVDYLVDKVIAYSVNEQASYDPLIEEDVLGNEYCQFKFMLDAKLHWNDEVENNVSNSHFFDNFSNWLKIQNENGNYPQFGNNITVDSIKATSNGYIFDTNSGEAIYRIECIMYYTKTGLDIPYSR